MGRTRCDAKPIFNEEDWAKVNKLNKRLLDDWLIEMKSKKKSPKTLKVYRGDIRMVLIHILQEFDNRYILELNKKDFRNINIWLMEERGVSNARANGVMSAVRSMLDFAEEDDDYDYDVNPAKKVKGLPKEAVRDIIFITDEQILKLREKLREMEKYQMMCILDMAYDSAARRSELHQVEKHGLLERNCTNVVTGKRGKKFRIIYFDRTRESLKLWLDQRGKDDIDSLWVANYRGIKQPVANGTIYDWFVMMADILSEMEGKRIELTTHSLRHCCLDNMSTGNHYMCQKMNRPDGFNIDELKDLAHHSDISTTNSYLKDRTDEKLASAFGISIED